MEEVSMSSMFPVVVAMQKMCTRALDTQKE
jgi:hypothetical protein